jgi:hypothetical protein
MTELTANTEYFERFVVVSALFELVLKPVALEPEALLMFSRAERFFFCCCCKKEVASLSESSTLV